MITILTQTKRNAMLNDKTSRLISYERHYPKGANSPTDHYEYECP